MMYTEKHKIILFEDDNIKLEVPISPDQGHGMAESQSDG